jgi:hypothetical protein
MGQHPLEYEDFSFLALRLVIRRQGKHLVNRDAAVQLAGNVLAHYYNPERYRLNMPLTITEAENGDDWIVTGSAPHITQDSFNAEPDVAGRYEIHINKYNARITKLVFT